MKVKMLLALRQLAGSAVMGLISNSSKTYSMQTRQSFFLSPLAIRDDSKPTKTYPDTHIWYP